MANNHFSDGELIKIMRQQTPTAHEQAFTVLSEAPSVKTDIQAVLAASESKDVAVDYLHRRTFQSLVSVVCSKKFEEKQRGAVSLERMYVQIFGHLLTVEPIRTGESDRLLKELYKDKAVLNTIKGAVSDYRHLDAQEILDQGFSLFYEAIYEAKYGGQATPRTYLIGICKTLILESGSSGRIKSEDNGETRQVKRVMSADTFETFDFDESDEGNRADFTVELEEQDEERQLLKKIVDKALDSKEISDTCKKALVMQYTDDLSLAQVAEKLGIAYQSAKNRAADCRKKLESVIAAIGGLAAFLRESFNIKRKKNP